MAAPDGSVTLPERLAPATCARTGPAENVVSTRMTDAETATLCSMETPVSKIQNHLPESLTPETARHFFPVQEDHKSKSLMAHVSVSSERCKAAS